MCPGPEYLQIEQDDKIVGFHDAHDSQHSQLHNT